MAAPREIVLINPPSAPGTTANREGASGMGHVEPVEGGFTYPPQTIAACAAVLIERGWSVRAIDAAGEGLDIPETLARLGDPGALVGMMISPASVGADVAFARATRQMVPDAKLIAFGPGAEYAMAQLQTTPLDAILLGEPEWALSAACERVQQSNRDNAPLVSDPSSLDGQGYGKGGLITDLDALPVPRWEALPHQRYRYLTLLSSRGCDHGCRYCPYVVAQGTTYRARGAESVAREMERLATEHDVTMVVFRDPVFARDPERVAALCYEILGRGIEIGWECESRPDHFSSELLRLMRRAGCVGIKIGVESASPVLLTQLGRVGSETEATDYMAATLSVAATCRDEGIRCRAFALTGLPGETPAMLSQTLEYLRAVEPTALNVKRFEAHPGTQLSSDEIARAAEPDSTAEAALLAYAQELAIANAPKQTIGTRLRRALGRAWRRMRR